MRKGSGMAAFDRIAIIRYVGEDVYRVSFLSTGLVILYIPIIETVYSLRSVITGALTVEVK